jgi:hypothetical protein
VFHIYFTYIDDARSNTNQRYQLFLKSLLECLPALLFPSEDGDRSILWNFIVFNIMSLDNVQKISRLLKHDFNRNLEICESFLCLYKIIIYDYHINKTKNPKSRGLVSNPRDLLSVPGLSMCAFFVEKVALVLVILRMVLFSNITLISHTMTWLLKHIKHQPVMHCIHSSSKLWTLKRSYGVNTLVSFLLRKVDCKRTLLASNYYS